MDLDEAIACFAGARFAVLATVAPDGAPRLVPVTFVLVGGVVVSAVDHKPKRTKELARLADLRARPVASVLADHRADDWSALWWVRCTGRAEVLEGGVWPDGSREALTRKYPPYVDRAPAGPVVVVRPRSWGWWSAAAGSGHVDLDPGG